MPLFDELVKSVNQLKHIYKPEFFRLDNPDDRTSFDELLSKEVVSFVNDSIYGQLKELIKSRKPSTKIDPREYDLYINSHLNGTDISEYGVWVFYPWNQTLVHLLDEAEFVEVRTNRNQYKITKSEANHLGEKKIGIIGLSVGHSIALTLATERGCGELRLADFDELELSNLNRIRTGVQNLGIPKVVIAAREIAEIDPFLKVKIFTEGLQKGNMDQFFWNEGKLDLLVEVCDNIDIKIQSRLKAKELQIPVVMDTNDRGMLDVERFDLEPEREIFHGMISSLIKDLDKDPSNASLKMQILMTLVSYEELSERLKYSMQEIGKTITTWPQLASSVVLGGAITAEISRQILLNQHSRSGRFYVDLDQIFNS